MKASGAETVGKERRQTPGLSTSSSTVLFQVLWLDAGTHRGGEHCHIVYINQPSSHVKVTGSAKVLLGGGAVLHGNNVWSRKGDAR